MSLPSINPNVAQAGISAGAGIISQILANWQSRKNIAAQAAYDRQLAEYQFDRNYQMWQEQNAYNTPAAQMARLKAAGLNPNLAYGNLASGVASNAPQFQQANNVQFSKIPGYSIPDVIGMYQNFRQNDLTAANTHARTANIKEQTATEVLRQGLTNSQKLGIDINNAYEMAIMNTKIALQKMGLTEKEANIRVAKMRASQLSAQADTLRYQLDFAKASRNLNLQLLNEQILSHQSNRALQHSTILLNKERRIGLQGENTYLGNYLSDYDQFMYQRGVSGMNRNPVGSALNTFAHGLSRLGQKVRSRFFNP